MRYLAVAGTEAKAASPKRPVKTDKISLVDEKQPPRLTGCCFHLPPSEIFYRKWPLTGRASLQCFFIVVCGGTHTLASVSVLTPQMTMGNEVHMKETTKMSRAVGQLEDVATTINGDLFGGELPTPITTQSKPGTWSSCAKGMAERRSPSNTREHSRRSAGRGDRGRVLTHSSMRWCICIRRENGIQEVSRGGKYHNGNSKRWRSERA